MAQRIVINSASAETKRKGFMKEIEEDYSQYGEYKMNETQCKNIMIIGRTRTGKSTIQTLLTDPTKVSDEMTLKSGTKDPQFRSFHVQEQGVVLNIIDTPGLFERSNVEGDIRPNEAIMKGIELCANMEITKFHVVCFCVAITTGINSQDVEALQALIKFLGDEITNNSCLLITHCESKDEEQRKKLRTELEQDTFFKRITNFFKLGVFFSGSLNRDDFNQGNESLKNQYAIISGYRKTLIDLFISIETPFAISEMIISQVRLAKDTLTQIATQLEDEKRKNTALNRMITDLKSECANEQLRTSQLRTKSDQLERVVTDARVRYEEQERRLRDYQEKWRTQDGVPRVLERVWLNLKRDLEETSKIAEGLTKKLEAECAKLENFHNELKQKYTQLDRDAPFIPNSHRTSVQLEIFASQQYFIKASKEIQAEQERLTKLLRKICTEFASLT